MPRERHNTRDFSQMLARAFQFCRAGQFGKAESACRQALKRHPRQPDALGLLGVVLAQQGKTEEALKYLARAVAVAPANAAFHQNFARALVVAGREGEAVDHYAAAATLDPGRDNAHYDLGTVLHRIGRYEDAVASFRRALSLAPDSTAALVNLGSALYRLGKHEEAVDYCERALRANPDLWEARLNLGLALRELGQSNDAVRHLKTVITQDPNHAEAQMNLAFCYLLERDFLRGWPAYEWRRRAPGARKPAYDFREWDGTDISGRTILVFAEQGIGDEIMFASCLPELKKLAMRVVVDCEPRLAPLFRRSFPDCLVHGVRRDTPHDGFDAVGQVDVQLPIGTLPRFLRSDPDNVPVRAGYLVADPSATARWRDRYAGLGGTLKVGIAWRGGGTPLGHATRSVPLDHWTPILRAANVSFVNLQHGECAGELEVLRTTRGMTVHDWPDSDPLKDLDDFAAKIAALDLVISIDNSTVHLAGALGQRVWTLLPSAPEWRWMLDRDDTPWYPTMRLIRQTQAGRWSDVMEHVAAELHDLAA